MASTRRLAIGIGVGALVLGALIGGLYAVRGRVPWRAGGHDATAQAAGPAVSEPPPPSSPDAVARGEVTIDPQRQQLIGVRVAPVTREPITGLVRTTGVVRYDETRLADVNVKIEGWIRELYVDYTGQPVQKGQPLFTFYSPDLLATQNEYLLALKTRDQVKESAIADARDYADRVLDATRQRLQLWDVTPEDIAALEQSRRAPDAITFRSPVGGFVLEKPVLRGMHVMPGQMLYKVADLSVVWVEADVYEQEMPLARVGQRATVTVDAYPSESFEARAIYVYPFVEENTRTVKVRFQLSNARGRLKPGMFTNVELPRAAAVVLSVPANAVLDSGKEQVLFVAQGDGRFTPRHVKTGRRLDDRIEVLDGVKEGEQVATGATFFLDSESQLRAGLQNYEAPPSAPGSASETTKALDITFRSLPDPPKTGEVVFEVAVKDPSGQPVTGAEVSLQFFMPAMPTMNMPAMRNEAKLPHVGGGVYRGPGLVMITEEMTMSEQHGSFGSLRGLVVVASLVALALGSAPMAAAQQPAGAKKPGLDIMLMKPGAPKTGENTFEVMVKGPDGKAITDADVTVQLYMAAMPAMKMPEMKNMVTLKHTKDGTYVGAGQVMMAGTWDATVVVKRAGKEVGNRKLPITAK